MLKKTFLVAVMVLAAGLCPAAVYYETGFEASEGYVLSNENYDWSLLGQGTPAWWAGYHGGEGTGAAWLGAQYAYSGSGILAQWQHKAAGITMGAPVIAKWFEFAFYEEATNVGVCTATTFTGALGSIEGIHMQLSNGSIICDGVAMGSVSKGEWHTMSFEHYIDNYSWGSYDTIYNSAYKVYVDGVYIGDSGSSSGSSYTSMSSLNFRTSTSNWANEGAWRIDNVNVGMASHFVDEPGSPMTNCTGTDFTQADINRNCKVDLNDYAILAEDWLNCTDPLTKGCENYRYKVAIVRSDYKYHSYEPGAEWTGDWGLLGCDVDEFRAQSPDVLYNQIDDYDIIMFTTIYQEPLVSGSWSTLCSKLNTWIQNGGLLIMEGVRSDKAPINWLSSVKSTWNVSVNDRLSGLPEWIDPNLLDPHVLADGVEVIGYNTGRAFNQAADYTSGGLTVPVNGKVLAKNRNDRATIWTDTFGNGRVVVTTYFDGYGLDKFLMEDILAWTRRQDGKSYEARFEEGPTIAEQVAATNPINSNTSPIVVSFDSDNVMQIDGSPFFPFGFFSVRYANSMQMMQTEGFNFAWGHDTAYWSYGLRQSSPSLAWNVTGIPTTISDGILDEGRIVWSIAEEPENAHKGMTNHQCKLAAQIASKLDPNRPTGIMCNNRAVFEGYLPLADIIQLDPYYVYSSTSSLVGIAYDIYLAKEVAGDKPIWTLLQAHSTGPSEETVLAKPTAAQLRGEMYVALAAGSKGISWFILDVDSTAPSYSYLRDGSDWITAQQEQWETILDLQDEFSAIESYLVGSDDTVQVSVTSPSSGVYALCFTRSASPQHLLIVVNAEASAKSNVTISWPLSVSSNTKMFADSPNITVNTGTHTITIPSMGGYQRGAYTFAQ